MHNDPDQRSAARVFIKHYWRTLTVTVALLLPIYLVASIGGLVIGVVMCDSPIDNGGDTTTCPSPSYPIVIGAWLAMCLLAFATAVYLQYRREAKMRQASHT
jgi:hypothetical protein